MPRYLLCVVLSKWPQGYRQRIVMLSKGIVVAVMKCKQKCISDNSELILSFPTIDQFHRFRRFCGFVHLLAGTQFVKKTTSFIHLLAGTQFVIKTSFVHLLAGTQFVIKTSFVHLLAGTQFVIKTSFIHLLVLKSNIFRFNVQLYKHVKGTAMGTPMAVNYANIFLDRFENDMLAEYERRTNLRLFLWMRYIDDICT